jgi:hypothetical protein
MLCITLDELASCVKQDLGAGELRTGVEEC